LNFELRLFLKALRYSGLLKLWLSFFLRRKESNLSKLDEEFFIFTLEKHYFGSNSHQFAVINIFKIPLFADTYFHSSIALSVHVLEIKKG